MKKLMVLSMVLLTASVANAALSLLVDGIEVGAEYTMAPGEYIWVGIYDDTGGTQFDAAVAITEGCGTTGDWTGNNNFYIPPAIPLTEVVFDPPCWWYLVETAPTTNVPFFGIQADFEFECLAAGDAVIDLFAADLVTVLDTLTIHQISSPMIAFEPDQISFFAVEGSDNPLPQSLSIWNSKVNTLNWQITDGCDWLKADPNSGSSSGEVDEVAVSVDIAGLDWGVYDCNLVISDPCAINNPQYVTVTLDITGPIIDLSDSQLWFLVRPGGPNPDDQILTIRNSGGGTLDWQVSEACGWLTTSPVSGSSNGEPNDVTLSADITGLAVGSYSCELTISANSINSPQTVPVILYVYDSDNVLTVPSEYGTIQAAIDAAEPDDTVIVADGIYTGPGNRDIDFSGKAITVRSANGPTNCIIDCQGTHSDPHRGFIFQSSEGQDSILQGVTITNGYHVFDGSPGGTGGGGIYCFESGPIIRDCIIKGNTAHGHTHGGSGCYSKLGANGGGLYSDRGSVKIINCIFSDNHTLSDVDYYNNGGAICSFRHTSIEIINCTFYNNSAYMGGAIATIMSSTSSIIIKNCIFWDNYPSDSVIERWVSGSHEACPPGGNSAVDYCLVQDLSNIVGEGNIVDDPNFVTGPLGNYYLSQTAAGQAIDSPCVDAGSDTALNLEMHKYTTRTDKIIDTGIVDMGYHYHSAINPADLNDDGMVNLGDVLITALQWLDAPSEPSADIAPETLDDFVNGLDFGIIQQNWLWPQ